MKRTWATYRSSKLTELGDVFKHPDEVVSTRGNVFSTRDVDSVVLADLGGDYPEQILTVRLIGDAKPLAKQIAGKQIIVSGTVIKGNNKPEIVVDNPGTIILMNTAR